MEYESPISEIIPLEPRSVVCVSEIIIEPETEQVSETEGEW